MSGLLSVWAGSGAAALSTPAGAGRSLLPALDQDSDVLKANDLLEMTLA